MSDRVSFLLFSNHKSSFSVPGVIETLYCLCEQLQLCIVPYIVLLVVPVLGAMSDSDHQIRLLATSTFASLVRLMPLDGGVPEPENLSLELKVKKEREKEFLSQLLDSRTAASYELSVPAVAGLPQQIQAARHPL